MNQPQADTTSNPVGRPRRSEGPRVPYADVDRALVFGEPVAKPGKGVTIVFPTYRELARRYGVSHSVIAKYAQRHNCLQRREIAQAKIQDKSDRKLAAMHAPTPSMTNEDAVRIIDRYLVTFEDALKEGRVRCDSAADLNTMLRLKQFVKGGPDSRKEVHTTLSLEALQARHRRMLASLADAHDYEPPRDGNEPLDAPASPRLALTASSVESNGRMPVTFASRDVARCKRTPEPLGDDPSDGHAGAHAPNRAPCASNSSVSDNADGDRGAAGAGTGFELPDDA
ncbi:hypothetical protein [Haliangium ochraceum]|uniref:Uncharacterized protein n=1 Tax=Haliangium ochraceum (strain DSM 14365 / JCM 11303 / SMP-2) TaxID=502025 RepID=D0LLL1_HALO1|nr:hypothetical protein [Haliangium ochraceum]ACY13228.1 hypothetical protein Hoch_0591 [Haliangium ochraceum DSM 14365]